MQRKEYFEGWNDYVNNFERKSTNVYYKEGYDQAKGYEKIHNKKPFPKKYQSKINLFSIKTVLLWPIEGICIIVLYFYNIILQKDDKIKNK